jgi:serine/threonine-protein kinase
MTLPLKDVLEGKYEILEKIGEGGIGAVYKVRHRLLEEIRVIKVLRPEAASKEDLRERFLHEARIAIRLKHPNIAQLHDFSIASDGRAYIVMEFIDGVSLDALLDASGPPSVDLALEVSSQALRALDYLHENNFVHRDVSPDNLMLASSFDGRPLVKLIDLGIARHLGTEVRLTVTGVFLGKARYCSPEQFSASADAPAEVDRRGDIYSFGIMLYELLTGIYPLHGNNFAELAGSHLFQPPKEFSETDPEGRLPDGLRAAVLRAMAKSPEDRYQTAAEFASALAPFHNPKASLRDEFDRTVEIATTTVARSPHRDRPGSTQDRLNEQFGMTATPAPTRSSDRNDDETVVVAPNLTLEESVSEIAQLVANGRRKRAIRSLDRALATHGNAEPLLELRAAVDRLTESRAVSRRLPLAALVGGIAVVVIGLGLGAWWWLSGTPSDDDTAPVDAIAQRQTVSAAPRWNPEAVDPTAAPVAPSVVEPPPLEAVESPPGGSEAGTPAGRDPDGGRPRSGPEERLPPPPGGEESRPQSPTERPPPPPLVITQELFESAIGVTPPVLLSLPEPKQPAGGRKLKEELTVVVSVLVSENGTVTRAQIDSGPSFRRRFREAALETAKRARFQPARRGNSLGRMWTEVKVTFQPE